MTIAKRLRKARAQILYAKNTLASVRLTLLESPHPFTSETRDVNDVHGDLVRIAARLRHMTKHHEHISNL